MKLIAVSVAVRYWLTRISSNSCSASPTLFLRVVFPQSAVIGPLGSAEECLTTRFISLLECGWGVRSFVGWEGLIGYISLRISPTSRVGGVNSSKYCSRNSQNLSGQSGSKNPLQKYLKIFLIKSIDKRECGALIPHTPPLPVSKTGITPQSDYI